MGKEKTCSRCGDKFLLKHGKRAGKLFYCGYCAAVVFGTPDEHWPHRVSCEEIKGRGFHKI